MSYRFNDSVPYLLNRAGTSLGEKFSGRIASYGVTLPMYRVLATLRQTGPKTLGELSALVSVELSTLSRLIGTMSRAGLVTRDRPPENARIVSIEITNAGQALADELMPIARLFEQTLVADLTEDQISQLKQILRQLSARVETL
jgi:DNA-binding MarR family transcriptional regulator